MKRLLALVALIVGQALATPSIVAQENRGVGQPRVVRSSERPRAPRPNQPVRRASHVVTHDPGYVVSDGEYIVDNMSGAIHGDGCSSCDGGGCGGCSHGGGGFGSLCNTCNSPGRFCICFPSHGWVSAEYLLWYQSGMQLPALATTGGTTQAAAGVLGLPSTRILYGADEVLDNDSSGFRIRFGWWLSSFPGIGIEGEYTGLAEQTDSFYQTSNGTPVIARPFFNVLTGSQDSELVAFPNVIRGNLAVDITSKLDGAAVRFRRQLCCSDGCGFSNLTCQAVPTSWRIDATLGYRFWELDESLQAREQLTSLTTASPGTFDITDRFETRNQFNGAELGVLWQGRRGWWSLDALMRLGIGNVHQTINVSGNSVITAGVNPGVTTNHNTGFLAQSSNIGTFERNQFTMVPELGLTAGYQLTKRVRLTTGYSLIYWGNVVRPGDQIDSNINPNLLAPQQTAVSLPNRPQFQFVETDYWVQGLSFGGEFRW